MEQIYRAEMKRTLTKLIDAGKLTDKAVFAFGHCNATEEMTGYLLTCGFIPAAILDNSVSKQGCVFREIPILSPEHINKYTAANSIVLIATRFYAEMAAQLHGLGYEGRIIKVVEYNSFAEYSLSDETLERKTARVKRGMRILEKIRVRYLAQHLVVCPNNALGDVYWAMAFLPAYKAKNAIGEVAVVVIGEACRQVAELFAAKNTVILDHTEMDELVQAIIFIRENNSTIAHHDRPYTDNIIKWLDKRFLSFIDYYRFAVYGLPKDAEAIAPSNFEPFENRERIPKGKTVILSPYAKSVVELPSDFWAAIVEDYLTQGYEVYTNVSGDDQPIHRTQPLCVPISCIQSAAEFAGTFIGIRSGLCDVLYTANCRKTVVFPDCYYSTTPHKVKDFFVLPGWKKIDLEVASDNP